MDWIAAREQLRAPLYAPLARFVDRLPAGRWPNHEELTDLADGIVTSRGIALRFVAPRDHTDRERRYYELPPGKRAIMGVSYFGLAGFLFYQMHNAMNTLQGMGHWSQ